MFDKKSKADTKYLEWYDYYSRMHSAARKIMSNRYNIELSGFYPCKKGLLATGYCKEIMLGPEEIWEEMEKPRTMQSEGKSHEKVEIKTKILDCNWRLEFEIGKVVLISGKINCLNLDIARKVQEKSDGILLLNPESNKHPSVYLKSTKKMIKSKAWPIVIATHSCHILDTVLIMIANGEISCKSVKMYHIDVGETVEIYKCDAEPNGSMLFRPSGFFDQKKMDIGKLSKIRSRKRG